MMKKFFLGFALTIAALIAVFAGEPFAADNFPDHPVTLLFGYPPGGVAGNSARAVATGTEKALGQPIVVLSKPGAAGTVAVDFAVQSKPDGYTLINAGTSTLCYAMFTEGVKWGPKDFTQILGYTHFNYAIVSSVDAPWKSHMTPPAEPEA